MTIGGALDTVLGVSMAPTAVRMVLVEGENADGALVDDDKFDVAADGGAATVNAAQQVVSAILGTREGAAEGGYRLSSTGVTWRDPEQAAALRDALANRKIENVVLVSAFLAAAALAHSVGNETNYAHTALLFIEPDIATLAVVDSADGSIADIHRQALSDDDDAAVAQLADMVSSSETLETHPDAVFVVGAGIDVPLIKPALEAATTLPVTAAEEPETALARGAALASANTPLLVSSTAAVAYAQDPGTGAVQPYALDAAYFDDVADNVPTGEGALAYSAVPEDRPERRPFALVASIVMAIFVVGVAALAASLAVSIRSTSDARPDPGNNLVTPAPAPPAAQVPAPTPQAPVPAPQQAPAPAPELPPVSVPQAPAPVPQAPALIPEAPAPVPQVPVPAPRAPAPVPQAPAPAPAVPAPAPAPAAPAPVPVPIPVPIQIPLPPILGGGGGGGLPGGKFPDRGGRGEDGRGKGGRDDDDDHGGGGRGGGGRGGFNIPFVPGI